MSEGDRNTYGFEKMLLYFLLAERIRPSQTDAAPFFTHLELLWLGLSFSYCHPAIAVHFFSTSLIRTPFSELHTTCHPPLNLECASDFTGPFHLVFPDFPALIDWETNIQAVTILASVPCSPETFLAHDSLPFLP